MRFCRDVLGAIAARAIGKPRLYDGGMVLAIHPPTQKGRRGMHVAFVIDIDSALYLGGAQLAFNKF